MRAKVNIALMVYLNIHLPSLETEGFLHATTSQIGTWLLLAAYCARQENGGKIDNCKNWSPATWTRIIGTETPDSCPLWHWSRNDLVLNHYPIKQEFIVQHRRAIAQNARARLTIKRTKHAKNLHL